MWKKNNSIEFKDKQLFDKISDEYSRKDLFESSKLARKFLVKSVFNLIKKVHNKHFFRNIIEIGCGHGANSIYMKGYYKNYLGIDYSKKLRKVFIKNGFVVDSIFFEGYFSPPSAQVILKPQFIFKYLSIISIKIDSFLHSLTSNRMAWNLILIGKS